MFLDVCMIQQLQIQQIADDKLQIFVSTFLCLLRDSMTSIKINMIIAIIYLRTGFAPPANVLLLECILHLLFLQLLLQLSLQ